VWGLFWLGRQQRFYADDRYAVHASQWCEAFGATQRGTRLYEVPRFIAKVLIREFPVGRRFLTGLKRWRASKLKPSKPYCFQRLSLHDYRDTYDRAFVQVRNLLDYTKTSESAYSAQQFPAGYHTIEINGRPLRGQRDPSKRLKKVPVQFHGKSVLDIGCNQGGMLFELRGLKCAVGVDYDAHMVNAANRIKRLRQVSNLDFYVIDIEREPLELIEDFILEPKVDIVFLLSVCMWLSNWREVISYSAKISESMLFETNGTDEQQSSQEAYIRNLYGDILPLADSSDDDPGQTRRKLFYCRECRSL
jgi:SAM-dependent methyltransferase